jgi:hypothetical protein
MKIATRASRVVSAGAVAAALALAGGSLPVRAAAVVAPPGGLQVVLDDLSPAAPKPGGKLVMHGQLRNTGSGTVHNASVSLLLRRRRLANRGEVRAVADGYDVLPQSTPVAGAAQPLGRDLPAGGSASWTISLPVAALHLSQDGVYALSVEAGGARDEPGGTAALRRVGSLTTFLPYLPTPKSFRPTAISWLWPLAGTPDRDGNGAFLAPLGGGEFAAAGRLADLAGAPAKLPVAWLLDPALLDSAAALAAPHQRVSGSGTVEEAADPAAAKWLADLRAELANRPVAALPYGDPDLSGLVHGGYPDGIAHAEQRARLETALQLGRQSDTSVAVPPTGLADRATLAALRAGPTRTVVLSGTEFPAMAELNHTPTGRVGIDTAAGHLEALLVDTGLADALSGDLTGPGTGSLAVQRLLADTAMITLERPNEQRSVLISPPRRWNPTAGTAARLLAATAAAPWLRFTQLASISQLPVPAEMATATPVYPPDPGPHELQPGYVTKLRDTAGDIDLLDAVLLKPGAGFIDNYSDAALLAASATWTTNPKGANAYLRGLANLVNANSNKVRVVGRSVLTLSSSHGTIPLTLANDLAEPVRVRAVIHALVTDRLRTQPSDLVTIAPGRKVPVRIPAEAGVNGITRVEVDLLDAAGKPFGEKTDLRVNVTNYGSVGLIVVLGGGGLLFAAAIIRNVRRVRRARSAAGRPTADPANRTAGEIVSA